MHIISTMADTSISLHFQRVRSRGYCIRNHNYGDKWQMISTWIYLDQKTDCHHQTEPEDAESHRCCCCCCCWCLYWWWKCWTWFDEISLKNIRHVQLERMLESVESFSVGHLWLYQCHHASRTWWRIGWVESFQPEDRGFDSRSSRHVGTLGKSLTRSSLWRFGVKLRHSIRALSEALLSRSGLEEAL